MILFFIVGITVGILLLDYCLKHFGKWKDFYSIPSPLALPLLGHMQFAIFDMDGLFKLSRSFALTYYPIFTLYPFGFKFVFLQDPHDIELILSDTKHIRKGVIYDFLHSWLGTGLLTSTGSKWHKRRKILTPSFHFKILQNFIEIFNEETKNLTDSIRKECHNPAIDVIPLISHFTLVSINETAMGTQLNVTENEKIQYKSAVHEMSALISYRIMTPILYNESIYKFTTLVKEEKRVAKMLHEFTRKVIDDRQCKFLEQGERSVTPDDYSTRKKLAMLDLLLEARNEGADIDIAGIQEEVDTFMFEGHDTTAVAICYMLMLLANHPDIQDEVFREINDIVGDNPNPGYKELQELKYTERFIKESLRLYPSVPNVTRVLAEDVTTTTGYFLPKGLNVNVNIYDMHHSPHVYENPEEFNIDRFLPENIAKRHPFAYLPFSAGPRNCIGQKFAMLELKAVLCGILRNFKLEAVTTPKDLKIAFDIILRSKESINVKFVIRE